MKDKLTVFPAIFTNDGEYYNVDFIDLKGCSTYGNSIEEAYMMAQNAMGLFLEDLREYPKPTRDITNIEIHKNQFISFISINMHEYRKKYDNKAVKKTLTIPNWLNQLAIEKDINFSQVLQDALREKLNVD